MDGAAVVKTAVQFLDGGGTVSDAVRLRAAGTGSPGRAYILDVAGSNQVQVLDIATMKFVASVNVGTTVGGFPTWLGITPNNKFVWVLQSGIAPGALASPLPARVNLIDTATNTITGSINLPDGVIPVGVAFTPDGKYAYLANYGSDSLNSNQNFAKSTMLVIDTATNTIVNTIATPGGAGPTVITPDGQLVYTLGLTNAITAIDTATNTISQTFPAPGATMLAMHPNGSRLYAAPISGTVSGVRVYETAGNTVVTTIPLAMEAGAPFGTFLRYTNLDVSADGGILTVYQRNTGKLTNIRTATNTVLDTSLATDTPRFSINFLLP